jgi:hypothetical protein
MNCFQLLIEIQLAPLHHGAEHEDRLRDEGEEPGRAVQVDPVKPMLKAPGCTRLTLYYDEPLSNFAFGFNLRRYNPVDSVRFFQDYHDTHSFNIAKDKVSVLLPSNFMERKAGPSCHTVCS